MKQFLLTLLLALGCSAQQITDTTAQQATLQNLVPNAGFENGKAYYFSPSGTFAVGTSNKLFGKNSAAFTPSATSQYFESSATTVPAALYGEDCMVSLKYKGADTNVYLTVMDGSSTELVPSAERAVLNAETGSKTAKIYFSCPSSGSIKFRLQSTASGSIGYYDQAYIGKSDGLVSKQVKHIGSAKYPPFTACRWTTVSTSFASFAPDGDCQDAALTGAALQPTTRIPAVRFTNLQPGRYVVVVNGFFCPNDFSSNAATQNYTISYSLGDSGETTSALSNTSAYYCSHYIEGVFDIATAQSSIEFSITAKTNNTSNAASIRLDDSVIGRTLSFDVYYYPSSTDTSINSKCPTELACTNEFSAVISSAGTVSGENIDWINGNASKPTTGVWLLTLNSLGLSNTLSCSITPRNGSSSPVLIPFFDAGSSSPTTLRYFISNSAGGLVDTDHTLICQKAGSDYKSKQTIQGFMSSMVSSSGSNVRHEFLSVDSTCSASPCTISRSSGSWISSVTRTGSGVYVLNFSGGTWASAPTCVGMNNLAAGTVIVNSLPNTASVYGFATYNSANAGTDAAFEIMCSGFRP